MTEKGDDKYEVVAKIGQGSFGIIRKVRRRTDNAILCRKEISYSRMSDKERDQLAYELKILESLRHPNIVKYYHREHFKTSHDLHLYMEYCGNGDLGGYIKRLKDEQRFADEEFVWTIFAQLVSALYRCHYGEDPPEVGREGVVSKGKAFQTKQGYQVILHRDLKPENVFLSQNNAVKLGDFGLSKIIASHDFASTYVGTPFYMSPEICSAERYSHHSDVWSLGCIIYELASRCVPFDARSHLELVKKINAGRVKPLPDMYSKDLGEIISWCLKVDSRHRPDTAQLLNVAQIKLARSKLHQDEMLERVQQERDEMRIKLDLAQKQVQDLQAQVKLLKDAEKKAEMEWHARATLAIDQKVSDARQSFEREKLVFQSELQQMFDTAVDQKVQQHWASLPQSHGLSQSSEAAMHVRSSTPPPGEPSASLATTATSTLNSFGSSFVQDQDHSTVDTDLSSLSITEEGEDTSPLAQRLKPMKKLGARHFGRAKTLANCSFDTRSMESPMDIHMADPSPMPPHVAPMSIKGLSLSPRRRDRLSGGIGLRKNIFSVAAEQKLRPGTGSQNVLTSTSFADDDLLDEDDAGGLEDTPSRPNSGLSTHAHGVCEDPFKSFSAVALAQPPAKRLSRPSLARQQTMPVQMQGAMHQQAKSNIFNPSRPALPEKENRPPSRSNVPIMTASPKRQNTTKDHKVLTPSRKAPPPPPSSNGLTRHTLAHNTPGKVRGRTLIELQQARGLLTSASEPDLLLDGPKLMAEGARLLPSPAKWDVEMGDEMPSPFLAKKGRFGLPRFHAHAHGHGHFMMAK